MRQFIKECFYRGWTDNFIAKNNAWLQIILLVLVIFFGLPWLWILHVGFTIHALYLNRRQYKLDHS